MRQEHRRFRAQSRRGSITIIEFREEIWFADIRGPRQLVSVITTYELTDGREVIRKDAKTLQIVDTDEIVREVS